MEKYVGFAVYECPENPHEYGKYIGKSPILEQAMTACARAKASGKNCFIKGIKADGMEVVII